MTKKTKTKKQALVLPTSNMSGPSWNHLGPSSSGSGRLQPQIHRFHLLFDALHSSLVQRLFRLLRRFAFTLVATFMRATPTIFLRVLEKRIA